LQWEKQYCKLGFHQLLKHLPMKNYHIFKKEFLSKIYCNKMHAILRRCGISLRNWNGDHHQASKQPMPLHLQPSQHPLSFPIQRHFWRNMWNFTQKIKNTHTPANPTLEVQNFLPTCPKIIQLLNLGKFWHMDLIHPCLLYFVLSNLCYPSS